ncbi:DUF421 domain-containing protein [Marivita sp. S6314]|uniref:DUF421 domain-containing protein n=1 Tax=Marivita sp. S6314 TaxID=2926406 RepID=UPI001FF22A56|nr:YetF domain-containing protein [Marivita sp. S6314]MCK0149577.1 DUF421 domain-containing protein [Marivita sp. S6314]
MIEDMTWTVLKAVSLSAVALIWVILLVRVVGLRSFSKMTSFDFVVTVATGSLLAGAGQASDLSAFLTANAAIAGLMGAQVGLQMARRVSPRARRLMQNDPVLLMENGTIDEVALAKTRVARTDLITKLREANVLAFHEVRAVVLETTGDISVLHGAHLSDDLLEGVRRMSGSRLADPRR